MNYMISVLINKRNAIRIHQTTLNPFLSVTILINAITSVPQALPFRFINTNDLAELQAEHRPVIDVVL